MVLPVSHSFCPKVSVSNTKRGLRQVCLQEPLRSHRKSWCEVVELNVQPDHVHLLVKVPPKVSISTLMGRIKGKTAIQAFQKFLSLRSKKYWGNHFWSAGYCVDTVGIDAEMIKKYVKYQAEVSRNYVMQLSATARLQTN